MNIFRYTGALLLVAALVSSCAKEPTACFTLDKTTAQVNEAITANASCSKEVEKYLWFSADSATISGDAISSSETYTFTAAGTYTIKLQVTNGKKDDETSQTVTITP